MKLYQDPEWLYQRYWNEGCLMREMAEEIGCSKEVIRYWMGKFEIPRRGPSQTVEERFWSKVDICGEDECWPWIASTRRGYGQFWLHNTQLPAHRVAWEIGMGDPGGFLVCHHCDNPLCCNPAHLFLGTPLDNTQDMLGKGRGALQHGEHNPQSKLTEEDVHEIRRLCQVGEYTHQEIGEMFSVARSTISQVATGLNWGWLE